MSRRRSCSYCLNHGHNRTTCSVLKADIENTRRAAKIMRGMFAEALTDTGITPGALLELKIGGGWNSEPHYEVYMVKKIHLNNIASVGSWRNHQIINLVKLKNLKSRRNMSLASVPVTHSFDFMKRHHDESQRWNNEAEKGFYVSEENIVKVVTPSHRVIKYDDHLTEGTKEAFNFKPASYREEDKWRSDLKMAGINKFLEKYGK